MKNKIFSILLLLSLMITGLIPDFTVVSSAAEENLVSVRLKNVKDGAYLAYMGAPDESSFNPGMVVHIDKDGNEFPAYCVQPNIAGVKKKGAYKVDVSELYTNPEVIAAIKNGYPYNKHGLDDYKAYYATQIAIWSLIHAHYSDPTEWVPVNPLTFDYDPSSQPVYDAMLSIYNSAKGETQGQTKSKPVTATASPSTAETDSIDDSYLSQTFTCTAESDYSVKISSSYPVGTKITDTSNFEKSDFKAGEQFKILVPKIDKKRVGSFKLTITTKPDASSTDNMIMFGASIDKYQNYAVLMKPSSITGTTTANFSETPDDIPPPKNDPNPGTLQINKLGHGTLKGLPGAIFRVADADGGEIGTYATNEKGQVEVQLTTAGVYYVEEIVPPEGYILSENNHQHIVFNPLTENVLTFENYEESSILLSKVDADTGENLFGAVVRIALDGGHITYDVTIDGLAMLNDLQPGTYTITEIVAPDGYLLDSTPRVIKLKEGEQHSVVISNKKKPGIVIKKYDEATGLPLPGAEFSVKQKDGKIVYEGITNYNGVIHVEGLEPDWYTINEIAAPDGYIMVPTSKTIELEEGKTVEVKFDNRKKPSLRIVKVDEDTGAPLANAIFKVWKAEGGTVSEYKTDDTGVIQIDNLDEAVYSIEEITAPSGYLLDTQHKDVELTWGKTMSVVFTNKKKPTLEIQKIDTVTGKPLSGAKFKVTKTEDKTVSEFTTGTDGKIIITDLDEAIYTVEEILAPEGYILDTQHKEIALEWGMTKTLIYENMRKPTLIITKINAMTYKPIPNTYYKVQYDNPNGGTETLGTYRTDENGQIVIPKIAVGWYTITEVKAAQGFSIASNPTYRLYLSAGENSYLLENLTTGKETENSTASDKISGITVTNGNGDTIGTGDELGVIYSDSGALNDSDSAIPFTLTSGMDYVSPETAAAFATPTGVIASDLEVGNYPLNSIVIRKTDAITGKLLPGARFKLYQMTEEISGSGGTLIGEFTTDNSGIIVISGLQPGGYFVQEDKAPNNYMLSENSIQQAWLKADGTTIAELTFANYPYGSILINKVDAKTLEPLANARFKVTDASGAVVGDNSYTTDANGEILVPNVAPGSYVITEIQAPDGYVLDSTPQTIEVLQDGKIYRVTFQNQSESTIVIKKYDDATNEPLSGAEFFVTRANGSVVGTSNGIFTTDKTGTITISGLSKGGYIVKEIKAPSGYILEQKTEAVEIDLAKTYTLNFYNKPMSSLQIIKIDADTKAPLKGAKFKVYKANGEVLGEYTTDGDGLIIISELETGWYKAVESKEPAGYVLDDTPKDFEITANQFVKLTFENKLKSSLVIKKIDELTGEPLAKTMFTLQKQNGEFVGEYLTDNDGLVTLSSLEPAWYIITETVAPTGYHLNETAKTVEVKAAIPTVLTFRNKPLCSIEIIKVNNATSQPLPNAKFTVTRDNGEKIGTFKTDTAGKALVTNLVEGTYIIAETEAPDGFQLDEVPKTVVAVSGRLVEVEFRNKPFSGIEIVKVDNETNQPLSGAKFKVAHDNGEVIGEYVTERGGSVIVPNLPEGTYVVSELIAPSGYQLDESPKNIIVTSGKLSTIEFRNKPLSGIEIIKLSSLDNTPLTGATFVIERENGELIGQYKTDTTGKIIVSGLEEGTYIVSETIAPEGFILDEQPKTVVVKSGKLSVLEFFNKPMQGLTIKKISSSDRQPIKGAEFKITEMDGGLIGNYKTDNAGIITVPELEPGFYIVSEVKAADGYFMDAEPQIVEIKWGEPLVIEIENTPISGIVVLKTDSQTRKPLAGVKFMVERWDGYRIGIFKTNAQGRIYLDDLPADDYIIYEIEALDGYELDPTAYEVRVRPGKQEVIEIQNTPLAGLRILKIDSVSKKPIYNVEFMVFNENGKVVGTYYTNNNGIIDFAGILPSGRYTIRETRPAAGYYADDVPKTIEFESGVMTEIVWENVPAQGQIQIYKTSADDNEMNGLPAGTPLSQAVFEVYEYKSGNMVDRFVSGDNGMAVSSPLPLGRYIVKEVKAPQYYKLSDKQLDITIEFATQIIKEEFKNYSVNLGVSIKKTGNYECMPGDTIAYTIKNVRNESTVPLNNFYWRDVIPTDAARLIKIVTGTYNKSVKYKVQVKTNKGNEMVIADNLKTSKNNVIDCSNAALGLGNDEYVTSFDVIFGNVPAGFAQVEKAQVYLTVKKNLPNAYQFANKADVGGTYNGEWQISNSVWTTEVYSKPQPLPNTGY